MDILLWFGCASSNVVPDSLEPQIHRNLTSDQIIPSPDSYRGRTFVVGGEVLKARWLKEGTQIEVLQLPLDRNQRPVCQRSESQGRLLARDPQSIDLATLRHRSQWSLKSRARLRIGSTKRNTAIPQWRSSTSTCGKSRLILMGAAVRPLVSASESEEAEAARSAEPESQRGSRYSDV
jgi:hypothetical protein